MTDAVSYDKFPSSPLPGDSVLFSGSSVWRAVRETVLSSAKPPLLIIDCYPGVTLQDLHVVLAAEFPDFELINVEEAAALDPDQIAVNIAEFETGDPVFGVMNALTLDDFYDGEKLATLTEYVEGAQVGIVAYGLGASRVGRRPHTLVIADMPRWEIQRRQRAGAPNWRATNFSATPQQKFKRGYFIEWRVADRHKMSIFDAADFFLDTSRGVDGATLLTGEDYRTALLGLTHRPFRLVPFFDPGVWGGEWMREKFELDSDPPNFAWCFDCVPEENSLRFSSQGDVFEFPAINLVLRHPRELLGAAVFDRFGAEFPIRFDMLDTMGGQNLSLQVHPLTEYIRDHFGMTYTQDESYYILDATPESAVYLGVQTGVDRDAMVADLVAASRGEKPFPADDYINRFPVTKHDHVSIPAGTVHCSAAHTMVLEISATPYIFTFKLWDWDRVDLNGKPRPIHLDHGLNNLQWDRDTRWVRENLLCPPEVIHSDEQYTQEKTGLHEREFIDTHRVWFRERVHLAIDHTVTVMTLVEGDIIDIHCPHQSFPPFPLSFGETVVLPAGLSEVILARSPRSESHEFATIRARCRDQ